MKHEIIIARDVFSEIGEVDQTGFDALLVTTNLGAELILSPNYYDRVPSHVHIDEITVSAKSRRRGIATDALRALCKLADKYQFRLEGGPIGWSDNPWREKFVSWVLGFGFERNPSPFLAPIDDELAFYVRRNPRAKPVRRSTSAAKRRLR